MFFKINKYIFLYIVKWIFEQMDKRFAWCKDQIKTKSYRDCMYNKKMNHFTKICHWKYTINTQQLLLIHTNNNIYSKHWTIFCAINIQNVFNSYKNILKKFCVDLLQCVAFFVKIKQFLYYLQLYLENGYIKS